MTKKIIVIKSIFCILVICMFFLIGVLTLLNNNEISIKEGRTLTTFNSITLESIKDESVFNTVTNAFSDQLAFRDYLIKGYYLINLQRYVGDVVEGENNQLFLSPLIIGNKENYEQKLINISKNEISNVADEITKAGAKFIFLSVPRKDAVMDKYLPSTYIKGTDDYLEFVNILKENVSDKVYVMDAYEIFKKNDVYDVFYTTDHHINVRGAYEIFEDIISIVNNDGYNIQIGTLEDEYIIKSQIINGSFNRKIGQSVKCGEEEMNLVPKTTSVQYTRMDDGKVVDTKVFGDGNTYAEAYMGADYAETVITTNNYNAPNILYVGSSYTNILEAFSVYKFKTMVSIDYRHNITGKSIVDYVKEYDIDYCIFICSQQTNALSISGIKQHLGLK